MSVLARQTLGDSAGEDDSLDDVQMDGMFENDLHLAAELGKTLLERNKELEANLISTQQLADEQAMQIVYLEKQLQILRDVTESKARVYEQLDLNVQELEKCNQRLEHENKMYNQKMVRMSESVESLEVKLREQQKHVEQLKEVEKQKLKEGRKKQKTNGVTLWFPIRRAHSFDLGDIRSDTNPFEDEVFTLKATIKNFKNREAEWEQGKDDLESEIAVLVKENADLEEKIREMAVRAQLQEIEKEYISFENKNEAICKYCDSLINEDDPEPDLRVQEIIHMNEKLEVITEEKRSLPNAVPKVAPDTTDGNSGNSKVEAKAEGISLMGEIDAQYRVLMDKYNDLLRRSRSGSFKEDSVRPRASSFRRKHERGSKSQSNNSEKKRHSTSLEDLRHYETKEIKFKGSNITNQKVIEEMVESEEPCPVDDHFEDRPPEYKKLFTEIFKVLRRPQHGFDSQNS
ncbi:cerebellar degeneration-related protein 2-like [Anneissia japonica]|uniref:cerebellar degeneration-related protein 2-like n=1 Tax=Anneissia japonica TaxID=1529436 RepID=UPI00142552DE|nr:cerebellar degeneration-related protein 2-like [Anneissia japonica]